MTPLLSAFARSSAAATRCFAIASTPAQILRLRAFPRLLSASTAPASAAAAHNPRISALLKESTPEQLYGQLPTLRQQLTPEEYEIIKEKAMEPYKQRNRMIGGVLATFVAGIFAYSAVMSRTDDLSDIGPSPLKKAATSA
ncbi:hypothetical protein HK405_013813 [Cladochytrium tenue]|nr:hypothetical protein HK405_013813 [Cladochytrium tenue]